MAKKLNTGIFGGSFNPFHNGHLAISEAVMEKHMVDELWLMVTPLNPWKKEQALLSDKKRLQMVSEAIAGMKNTKASDFEFNLPVPTFTANTLKELTRTHPERKFTLIIGSDNWNEFDKWQEYEYIQKNYDIIVYPRSGSSVSNVSGKIRLLDSPKVEISSSQIIERLRNGLAIDRMVPKNVADTIYSESLFKD